MDHNEEEIHNVVLTQFEYITKAVKTSETKIEISGLGYLTVNFKHLEKDILRQESLKKNLEGILEREDQEEILRTTRLKLESLLPELEINYSKREKIKKDLEQQEGDTDWDLEQDIS